MKAFEKNKTKLPTPTNFESKDSNNGISNESDASCKEISHDRLIDRLDIQLLLAIIVFFVSAWAYMNSIICDFTGNESHNERMSYIIVHYILTVAIVLCLFLTYKKGTLLLDIDHDVTDETRKYFDLFLSSWINVLGICLGILVFSSFSNLYGTWFLGSVVFLVFLFYETNKLKFTLVQSFNFLIWIIAFFPIYLSTMTILAKNIEIITDKPYYTLDDDIIITVNAKGYACEHKMVCLGGMGPKPTPKHDVIRIRAVQVKNNKISVGLVSPASGLSFFMEYPIRMIFDMPNIYPTLEDGDGIYYKDKNINITDTDTDTDKK